MPVSSSSSSSSRQRTQAPRCRHRSRCPRSAAGARPHVVGTEVGGGQRLPSLDVEVGQPPTASWRTSTCSSSGAAWRSMVSRQRSRYGARRRAGRSSQYAHTRAVRLRHRPGSCPARGASICSAGATRHPVLVLSRCRGVREPIAACSVTATRASPSSASTVARSTSKTPSPHSAPLLDDLLGLPRRQRRPAGSGATGTSCLSRWYAERGERLAWDSVFVAQWDLVVIGPAA